VRVSLDSRNDLYGRQLVLAEQQVLAGKWLRTSQGWKLTASDPAAALFVRR
jgi:hypothetical protein